MISLIYDDNEDIKIDDIIKELEAIKSVGHDKISINYNNQFSVFEIIPHE